MSKWQSLLFASKALAPLKLLWRLWRHRRVPIAVKMALVLSVVTFLAMGLLALAAWTAQKELLSQQIRDYGSTIAQQWASTATESLFTDDSFTMQVLVNNLVRNRKIYGAAVFDEFGQQRVHQGVIPQVPLAYIKQPENRLEEDVWIWEFAPDESSLIAFVAPISFRDVKAGDALVVISKWELELGFGNNAKLLLWMALAAFVVMIVIARLLSRAMAQPITRLVEAADAIGQGDYTVNLTEKRNDELGELVQALNRSARNLKRRQEVENVVNRLVDRDVAESLLSQTEGLALGSQEIEATVVFVDIVAFTSLSEQLETAEVVQLLNEFFDAVARVSNAFNGTIDKFIGDCAMVLFGAPKSDPHHRLHGLCFSRAIILLMSIVNRKRIAQGLRPIEVRVGVNSGELMAGIVGASDRMEYTAIGDVVNLASRLSGLGPSSEILASGNSVHHQSLNNANAQIQAWKTLSVKGKKAPVDTYLVSELSPEDEAKIKVVLRQCLSDFNQLKKSTKSEKVSEELVS
ncbi:adenylate/guanylate cyclase domain-containing protein [Marinibactrum halimedae]|uniref:HAMP domain-containing protein n=1 Tax=Marinibactrum halimedae TaxID=1444977 RepID=A0AA37T5J7_9GAMM|nr:adenylate/guanylate cyclase domain-containing protein [Marinibactrum halimedae]MCD9460876.1 HAMP domain-containing protein [Marinibactrum halimedae]GLS27345.1 hypothetical protein GCM10007877_30640 [Marinibactrum halimedae]